MNQHPLSSPCSEFELNWLRNKKVTKNIIFDGTSGKIRELKLEMTSYSDNAYDVTNFLVVLKSSWPILYFYPSKIGLNITIIVIFYFREYSNFRNIKDWNAFGSSREGLLKAFNWKFVWNSFGESLEEFSSKMLCCTSRPLNVGKSRFPRLLQILMSD